MFAWRHLLWLSRGMNAAPPISPFDSNRAWQDALSLIKTNRDLLIALAGAFLVLPAFAIAILLPLPEPAKDGDLMAFATSLGEYYRNNAPALVISGLIHTAGTLAMLALFTDPSRPTVGQAIRQGFARMPTVIFAQIIMCAGVGAMLIVPATLGGMLGSAALSFLGAVAAFGLGVWALTRLSLIPAVVVVEQMSNPLKALNRAWLITEGHALRLLVFFALLFVATIVLTLVASGLVNALLSVLIGGEAALLGSTLIATSVQAAMSVCFNAVFAASYRQLTETPIAPVNSTFN